MAVDTMPLFSASRNTRFYVYIYTDPRRYKKNQPIYVGKGTAEDRRPDFRANIHWLYEAKNPFFERVLIKIYAAGFVPGINIVSWFEKEADAFTLEIALIAKFGRRDLGLGPLCNLTNGGEGMIGRVMTEQELSIRIDAGKLVWKKASKELKERMRSGLKWGDAEFNENHRAAIQAWRDLQKTDPIRFASHVANAAAAKRTEEARADASVKQTDVRANETSEQKASSNEKVKAARIADRENTGLRAKVSWARPGQKEKQGKAIADGQSSSWADPEKKAIRLAKLHATNEAKKAQKAAKEALL